MPTKKYENLTIKKTEDGYSVSIFWESRQGNIYSNDTEEYHGKDIEETMKLVEDNIKKLS